jgi:hypothetical protein
MESKMKNLRLYAKPFMWFSALLMTALVTGCGGGGDQGRDPILGLPASALVSVAVTPANASTPIGGMQQFVATATYADGASRDVTTVSVWSSSAVAVATVGGATGITTGVSNGTSTISASFGAKSGSATLTIAPVVLVSIAILPANASIASGSKQQFTAMGTFSNGTSSDISAISTFMSATPSVATILASGLASGVSVGTSLITARSGVTTGSTLLTVTPVALLSIAITPANPTLQIGVTRALTVTATFSDSTTSNVTSSTSYVSATTTVVTVGASTGVLAGVAAGSSVITATYNGKTATTTATVSATTLSSIAITPINTSIVIGSSQQFSATGTYADGSSGDVTTTVTWTSSDTNVATIVQTGKASGLTAGVTTIAAAQGTKTASTTLTVTAPVVTAGINLGTAASFAVLAGTSITNNSGGITLVTGDVGSPSQTVDPTQAAGFTNYKSGAILNGALADLQVAVTDANSRTCDVNSAAGIDLGGLTFGPGVYCYAGAISITGTFTMNGPGVYIFRTSSTINTTANSIVALNGGATAGNAFWVPTAATTLGANSVFKGTIMSSSGAITMGDTATLQNGRVLTGTAATLRNNVITR